jgi:hypothetical protein
MDTGQVEDYSWCVRSELVSSVDDWTEEFLTYLSEYVWPKEPADQHTSQLHKLLNNRTYFADKLTQFLFSFKGTACLLYVLICSECE